MSILVTSANPLGLRALGSGGRTAVASFEQITRTLRQSLGPDHASLFAEPSPRGGSVDWFTEAERGETPVRLTDADAGLRNRGLARLETLVRDVEAKAVSLRKSDRQDERILGDMLTHAREIPSADAVFLIGERPVLTFWGYVRDSGQPAVKPLNALLLRPRAEVPAAPPPIAPTPERVTDGPPPRVVESLAAPRSASPAALGPAILWALLTLLLLTCGVELLRGCALGLPHGLTGWLLDYCAAPPDAGASADLAAERARQAKLQAEYDDLVRQAALARQACQIKTGKGDAPQTPVPKPRPPVVAPTPTPPKEQMKIPEKPTGSLAFLDGCWKAHDGLTYVVDGKDTGKTLGMTYCFNKDGSGSRFVRFDADGSQCRGTAQARLDGDKLTITLDRAACEGGKTGFDPAVDTCRRGDEGVAICDEAGPNGKPDFTQFPFTRTADQP